MQFIMYLRSRNSSQTPGAVSLKTLLAICSSLAITLAFEVGYMQYYFSFKDKMHDNWILATYEENHMWMCARRCQYNEECSGVALGPLEEDLKSHARRCYLLTNIDETECADDEYGCKQEGVQIYTKQQTRTTTQIFLSSTTPTITTTTEPTTTEESTSTSSTTTTSTETPTTKQSSTTTTQKTTTSTTTIAPTTEEKESTTTTGKTTTTEKLTTSTTSEPTETTIATTTTTSKPTTTSTTTSKPTTTSTTVLPTTTSTEKETSTVKETTSTSQKPDTTTTERTTTITEKSPTTTSTTTTTTTEAPTTSTTKATTTAQPTTTTTEKLTTTQVTTTTTVKPTTTTTEGATTTTTTIASTTTTTEPTPKEAGACTAQPTNITCEGSTPGTVVYGLESTFPLFTDASLSVKCDNRLGQNIFQPKATKVAYEPFSGTFVCEENEVMLGLEMCFQVEVKYIAPYCVPLNDDYELARDDIQTVRTTENDKTKVICPDKSQMLTMRLESKDNGDCDVKITCVKIRKK